jgi:hypothetical protein
MTTYQAAQIIGAIVVTAGVIAVLFFIGKYLADDQADRLIRKLDRDA